MKDWHAWAFAGFIMFVLVFGGCEIKLNVHSTPNCGPAYYMHGGAPCPSNAASNPK